MLNLKQAVDFLRSQVKAWDAEVGDSGVQLIAKIYGAPAIVVLKMLKEEDIC